MFDRIIYRLLDTIVDWCERYKKYKIDKTLPKPNNKKELAKWVKQGRSLINNYDTDYTGNTKTTIQKYIQ